MALVSMLGQGDTDSGDVARSNQRSGPEHRRPAIYSAPPPTTLTTAPQRFRREPSAPSDPTPGEHTKQPLSPPIGLRIETSTSMLRWRPYGVNQRTGQMAVPSNVTEVGWYKFGPSPGEPGSAVLAAHVDLAGSGPGVFFDLQTLEDGDRSLFSMRMAARSPFRVVARTTYEKNDLPLDVIFSREGPPVLTLITCGGGFNTDISRYDSNVVVYAVPDLGTRAGRRFYSLGIHG